MMTIIAYKQNEVNIDHKQVLAVANDEATLAFCQSKLLLLIPFQLFHII
jgi:hypothetical protein